MVPLALIAFIALAVGAAAAAWSSTSSSTTSDACSSWTAADVPLNGGAIMSWLRCPGRTATQVRALTDRLHAAGDAAGAAAVAERWAQIRGELPASSATDAAARRALGASDAEASAPGFVSTTPSSAAAPPPSGVPPHPAMATAPAAETAPAAPGGLPAGANPDVARRLAGPLARQLRGSRPGMHRNSVRAFQSAAGINPDGIYGGLTANALAYFGIEHPPDPHQPPYRDDPRAVYPPR